MQRGKSNQNNEPNSNHMWRNTISCEYKRRLQSDMNKCQKSLQYVKIHLLKFRMFHAH